MKSFFRYVTILLLVIISIGYFVNGYKFFSFVNSSSNDPMHVPTNWSVETVDPVLAESMKFQKGDSLISVGSDRQINFITLDNDLVANAGKEVDVTVLRGGKEVIVHVSVPADFQVNDFEKRVVFTPTYKGSEKASVLTPYTNNRLMFGTLIVFGIGLLAIADAVFIFLKKPIGWYIGVSVVLIGLAGLISGGDVNRLFSRSLFFILLAICLALSYKKVRKEP